MFVLVTGARAPVAIEWANLLTRLGHSVILTDSLDKPLGAYCQHIEQYIKTHSPRFNFTHYQSEILVIIDQFNIDMVIPTCEEIYYLAKFAALRPEVNWLLPETEILYKLHNKYAVFNLLKGLPGISLPFTKILSNRNEVDINNETILKPLYSRFGSEVIRNVSEQAITNISLSPERQWVQQQKITGQSICNYALFEHGKLSVHQAYEPKYCVNQSAASAFKPLTMQSIETFMIAFGQRFHYHGQVSFDFIIEDEQLYVIECNPRATSGLHLVANNCQSIEPCFKFFEAETTQLHHLGCVMLFAQGISSLFKWKGWQDYLFGQNVMPAIRFYGQLSSVIELYQLAKRYQIPLSNASTYDIEWNGEA